MVHDALDTLTLFAGLLAKHTQKRQTNQAMPVAPVTRFNKRMNQKFGSLFTPAIHAGRRYPYAAAEQTRNPIIIKNGISLVFTESANILLNKIEKKIPNKMARMETILRLLLPLVWEDGAIRGSVVGVPVTGRSETGEGGVGGGGGVPCGGVQIARRGCHSAIPSVQARSS